MSLISICDENESDLIYVELPLKLPQAEKRLLA